jgi:hypothetical protein
MIDINPREANGYPKGDTKRQKVKRRDVFEYCINRAFC